MAKGGLDVNIIKVKAKRAFSPTKIPGANYVINQYVGCQHACKYCYAKFIGKWYSYGKWGNWIVIKENLPELVRKEKVSGRVYMSSVSDPYQPIEKRMRLTRRILENMERTTELSILTKSALVLRDIDIFKGFDNIEVGLTINGFFDSKLKREVEPLSSPYKKRVKALRVLHESGIKTYAFISPIVPNLVDVEEIINETKKFVDFYWLELLNLRASGEEFRRWLRKKYPGSYRLINDKTKIEGYIEELMTFLKGFGVKVKGVVTHYPNFKIFR